MPESLASNEPNVAYALRYLASHLALAGRGEDLHSLVAESENQVQIWAEERYLHEESFAGYLEDVQIAWHYVADAKVLGPNVMGKQLRYSLIESSIRALAENLPAELLIGLVENQIDGWTPQRALSHALLQPNETRKAKILASLAKHLPSNLLNEALREAQRIGNEDARAQGLTGLALHLPLELRDLTFDDALAAARVIQDNAARACALRDLAALASADLQTPIWIEAVTAVKSIEDEVACCRILLTFVPYQHLDRAGETLAIATGFKNPEVRARALRELGPGLTVEQREQVLSEALVATLAITDEDQRAWALMEITPFLSPASLETVLSAAKQLRNEDARARILSVVVPRLPIERCGQELGNCLSAARRIRNEQDRAWSLLSLCPSLPVPQREHILGESLAAARSIERPGDRAFVLSAISSLDLAPEQQEQVLSEAAHAVEDLDPEGIRFWVQSEITPVMPSSLIDTALVRVRTLPNTKDFSEAIRRRALAMLAPRSSLEVQAESLANASTAARGIHDEDARKMLLGELIQYLLSDEDQSREDVEIREPSRALRPNSLMPGIDLEIPCSSGLDDWELDLASGSKTEVLRRRLERVRALGGLYWLQASELRRLAPHLSPDFLEEALEIARNLPETDLSGSPRARTLGELAAHVAPELQDQVFSEALSIVRGLPLENFFGSPRAEALAELADHMQPEQRGQVLIEAVNAARGIAVTNGVGSPRVLALTSLAARAPMWLHEQILNEALAVVRDLKKGVMGDDIQARVLGEVVSPWVRLARQEPMKAYALWVPTLHFIGGKPRPEALASLQVLVPVIMALGGVEAVRELTRAVEDTARWWP